MRDRTAACLGLAACLAAVAACRAPRSLDEAAILAEVRGAARPGGVAVDLDEAGAIRLAAERSPTLAVARAEVAEAAGEASRARAFDNPEVRVDNAYQRRGNDTFDRHVYRLGVDLRLNLPHLGERLARVDAADANTAAARAALAAQEAQVRREVRLAFARVASARARAGVLGALVGVRERRVASLARAVETGQRVAADVARARVALGEARDRLGAVAAEEEEARGALGRVLGTATPGPRSLRLPPGDEPACAASPGDLAALEERALARRPELEERRALHRRAREEVLAESMARTPWPRFLEFGYSRNFLAGYDPVVPGNPDEPRYVSWAVHATVALEIPLWDWNKGRRAAAEARLDRQEARFREVLAGTLADLGRENERWRAAADRVRRARDETLPAADEAARLARSAAATGHLAEAAALEVEERALLARLDALESALECREAEIEVERLAGR